MSVPGEFVREFLGICHGGPYQVYTDIGARWSRNDYCVWQPKEPGAPFSFDRWDRDILSAMAVV